MSKKTVNRLSLERFEDSATTDIHIHYNSHVASRIRLNDDDELYDLQFLVNRAITNLENGKERKGRR